MGNVNIDRYAEKLYALVCFSFLFLFKAVRAANATDAAGAVLPVSMCKLASLLVW